MGKAPFGWLAIVLGVWLGAVGSTQAQPEGFRLERYAPPPTPEDGLAIEHPDTLGHLRWSAALTLDYGLQPLTVAEGTRAEADVVEHRFMGHLTAAMGLLDFLQLQLRLPLVLAQSGQSTTFDREDFGEPESAGVGDMALGVSARLHEQRGFTFGGSFELVLPTGDEKALAGDQGLEPWGWALASYEVSIVTLAAQVGGGWRPERVYGPGGTGSEVHGRLGTYVKVHEDARVSVELWGSRGLEQRGATGAADDFETLVGAQYQAPFGLRAGLAVGAGFSDVYGSPTFRAVMSVGAAAPRDATRAPEVEAEPVVVEDRDGDGVPDEVDACGSQPEDTDGFQDGDGCPDPDNDGDGILDIDDACVDEPEDGDGRGDRDGCPDPDDDEDGIPDVDDQCPEQPEDQDGVHDADGCPDIDEDGDGLDDAEDNCPSVPGGPDTQGCPVHVAVEDGAMVLKSPIKFVRNKATLQAEALDVLDELASVFAVVPAEWGVLHLGVKARNRRARERRLAMARAEALVAALVQRKVPADRLKAEALPRGEGPSLELRLVAPEPPAAEAPAAADDADPEAGDVEPEAAAEGTKKPAGGLDAPAP